MIHLPKWTYALPLLILVLTMLGCEKEPTSPQVSPTPRITEWEVPARMAFNSPRTYRLTVTVEDPQGPQNVPFALGTIIDNGVTLDTFSLWDDGSDYAIAPQQPWADSTSGDLIPGDGIFSRRITGQFVDHAATVSFQFDAADSDGHTADPVEATVEMRANSAPVLDDPQLPDTLVSRFDPVTLSVRATDPDDQDSLVRVWLEVEGSGKGEIILTGPDQDQRWSVTIDRYFAAGIMGAYPFNFYGEDTFQEIGGPAGQIVMVENNPPVISNLVAPDTMVLPTETVDSDTALLFLNVDDDQTSADVWAVYFTSVFNDTVPNPNVFYLFDDGTGADVTAGDGIYSQGIVLFWNNTPGKYTFTFIAQDLLAQTSVPIIHDMWVIPAPGVEASPELRFRLPIVLRDDRSCSPFHEERRLP